MRVRLIAAISACCLFLCACSVSADHGEASALPEPAYTEAIPPVVSQELVFSISRDASDILRQAAQSFCDQLEDVTDGLLVMTVKDSIAPDADLIAGRAQMALLNKKRQLEFSPPLAATATPFLYTGYRSFTVRTNAEATLDILEKNLRETHEMVPLAAFYQGSLHLITDFSVANYQYFEFANIAVTEDDAIAEAVTRLGAVPVPVDSDEERFELFFLDQVGGAEISLAELNRHSTVMSAQSYLVLSSHNTIPVWLMASAGFYDSLTDVQRAEMQELCAYMTNLIDDFHIESERVYLSNLEISNLEIITEFSNVRNRVFNTMPALSEEASVQEWVARDLVDRMRRLS